MLKLQPQKISTGHRRAKHLPADEPSKWVGLWSLSLGVAAIVVASLVYFAGGDGVGASLILFGAAGFIALIMRASVFTEK